MKIYINEACDDMVIVSGDIFALFYISTSRAAEILIGGLSGCITRPLSFDYEDGLGSIEDRITSGNLKEVTVEDLVALGY